MPIPEPLHLVGIDKTCPRCHSLNTKWRYFNNRKSARRRPQPRYFCRDCKMEFTVGGKLWMTMREKKLAAEQKAARRRAEQAAALEKTNKIAAKLDPKGAKDSASMVAVLDMEPIDGSSGDMLHAVASVVRYEAESMPNFPCYKQLCELLSRVDGARVMELVEGGVHDLLVGSESKMVVDGAAQDVGGGAASSETWGDGLGHDSGMSLLEFWGEHRGKDESGLSWLPDPCGEAGAYLVDLVLAWSDSGRGGSWADCGLGRWEVWGDRTCIRGVGYRNGVSGLHDYSI